jgi:hypothetical protein
MSPVCFVNYLTSLYQGRGRRAVCPVKGAEHHPLGVRKSHNYFIHLIKELALIPPPNTFFVRKSSECFTHTG